MGRRRESIPRRKERKQFSLISFNLCENSVCGAVLISSSPRVSEGEDKKVFFLPVVTCPRNVFSLEIFSGNGCVFQSFLTHRWPFPEKKIYTLISRSWLVLPQPSLFCANITTTNEFVHAGNKNRRRLLFLIAGADLLLLPSSDNPPPPPSYLLPTDLLFCPFFQLLPPPSTYTNWFDKHSRKVIDIPYQKHQNTSKQIRWLRWDLQSFSSSYCYFSVFVFPVFSHPNFPPGQLEPQTSTIFL